MEISDHLGICLEKTNWIGLRFQAQQSETGEQDNARDYCQGHPVVAEIQANRFERDPITVWQSASDDRDLNKQTLDLGWRLLTILPREELKRVKEEQINKYLPKETAAS